MRCYSTADAVVLANGDLLVACSFRASAGYKYGIGCGIVLKRSRDHGRTWSDEQVIFEGTNWEPYLLQLPDGRVQCYFTDCLPATRNSGTSVITSADNGHTWGTICVFAANTNMTTRGGDFYGSDAVLPALEGWNDAFRFLEARLEPEGPSGKSVYKMSIVGTGDLTGSLSENRVQDLPTARRMSLKGVPDMCRFSRRGETLVSCNIDRVFRRRSAIVKGVVSMAGPGTGIGFNPLPERDSGVVWSLWTLIGLLGRCIVMPGFNLACFTSIIVSMHRTSILCLTGMRWIGRIVNRCLSEAIRRPAFSSGQAVMMTFSICMWTTRRVRTIFRSI